MDCSPPGSSVQYWSGLPLPYPGHFPDPGIEPRSPALRADSFPSEPSGKLVKTHYTGISYIKVKEYGQILSLMKLKFLVLGRTLKFPKITVTLKKERQKLPELMIEGLTPVCGNQRGLPWRSVILDEIWEGDGNPLQYSCLENSMEGGAW